MKFKLDENLGSLGKAILAADGHDVMTVIEQRLSGASDQRLYEICREEGRVLVTLDQDFGEVLRFPPEAGPGIAVLAIPGRMSPTAIVSRISEMAKLIRTQPINGQLWIIEPGRIRIRQPR